MTGSLKRRLDFLFGVPALWGLSFFAKRRSLPDKMPERILVIKLAAAGDAVLLIPVLRSLRQALPKAAIDWLASPVNQSIASSVPYVERVISLADFKISSIRSLIARLRERRYDLVIDFEQWARGTALLSWLTNAPERIGFKTPGQYKEFLFTRFVLKRYDRHEVDEFFGLVSSLIPVQADPRLELWETPLGLEEIKKMAPGILETRSPGEGWRVLLHPGCGRDGTPREWPLARYVELGRWLQERRRTTLFLSGGPEEAEKVSELARALPGSVNLAGRLSWFGMISLVKRMDLVVSGNTGVMHVAAAWQRPQVALHGPTHALLWGPLNPWAKIVQSPCPRCPSLKLGFEYHRADQSCMEKIPLQKVIDAIESLSQEV